MRYALWQEWQACFSGSDVRLLGEVNCRLSSTCISEIYPGSEASRRPDISNREGRKSRCISEESCLSRNHQDSVAENYKEVTWRKDSQDKYPAGIDVEKSVSVVEKEFSV